MNRYLQTIREPAGSPSAERKILASVSVILLGFFLGVFQKWLDSSAVNDLPQVFQRLDITNFFGRFAVWILLAVVISVYDSTPVRASVNTFLFFISMVSGYYLYCAAILGFFPRSYAMIWIGLSFVSPIFAYVCWYAKGKGLPAIILSALILGVLFAQAVFLTQGLRVDHVPEVILWAAALILLRREPKEFTLVIGLSLVAALAYQLIFPY